MWISALRADLVAVSDFLVFHLGSGPGFVRKAYETAVRTACGGATAFEKERAWAAKVTPSLQAARRIGPMHSVATYVNLWSLFSTARQLSCAAGASVNCFSYGSGCAASMYSMSVERLPSYPADVLDQLASRAVKSVEETLRLVQGFEAMYVLPT